MKAKIAVLLGVFILIGSFAFTPAHAQKFVKDEYGVSYSVKDGVAKTTSDKRDQLFRILNLVRSENQLAPLVYQSDDQALADLRVRELARNFVPSGASCRGEVIFKGTFGEITALATNYRNKNNFQYLADVENVSVGLARKRDVYYAVIRIF